MWLDMRRRGAVTPVYLLVSRTITSESRLESGQPLCVLAFRGRSRVARSGGGRGQAGALVPAGRGTVETQQWETPRTPRTRRTRRERRQSFACMTHRDPSHKVRCQHTTPNATPCTPTSCLRSNLMLMPLDRVREHALVVALRAGASAPVCDVEPPLVVTLVVFRLRPITGSAVVAASVGR